MLLLSTEAVSFTSHHTINFSSYNCLILATGIKLKKKNKELDVLTKDRLIVGRTQD